MFLHAACGALRARTAELRRSSLETQQLATRLRLLQAQVEPHFLFNTVATVVQLVRSDAAAARRTLARLIDYDSAHGTQLVLTLSEYLECGGNYDASAKALSVHRSTLKYRLNRIRQVSGYDLSLPDNQFNLQLATRAWRTLQALRQS